MKKIILIILFFWQSCVIACPTCERQQPKILRGIVHGQGPDSSYDYIIVVCTILIALVTLYFSAMWLLKPSEKNTNHIKYSILNKD